MPLSQYQPYSSGKFCECDAELILCDDWERGKWVNVDPNCPQCKPKEQGASQDEIDTFVDKLIHSINQRTKLINDIDTIKYTP